MDNKQTVDSNLNSALLSYFKNYKIGVVDINIANTIGTQTFNVPNVTNANQKPIVIGVSCINKSNNRRYSGISAFFFAELLRFDTDQDFLNVYYGNPITVVYMYL